MKYWDKSAGAFPLFLAALFMCRSTGWAISLWWRVERLATLIGVEEERFVPAARKALHRLEKELSADAVQTEAEARRLIEAGERQRAMTRLPQTTVRSVERLMELCKTLAD